MRAIPITSLGALLLTGISLSAPAHAQAQTSAPPALAPSVLDSIARRIVTAARYATLATVDGAGRPQVRTIQPRHPDATWSVWFATNPRTRKVKEVERRGAVALHYFDPATQSYVAVTGTARVVRDRATQDAHWDDAWTAFYPDRTNGVVLIVVDAARVEVVSPKLGVESDALTWRPQSFTVRPAGVGPARRRP
jgi:general stress protein 26